jgi:hypothetical protein
MYYITGLKPGIKEEGNFIFNPFILIFIIFKKILTFLKFYHFIPIL